MCNLPGIEQTSTEVHMAIQFLPITYLGSAYGSLAGRPPTSYIGAQDVDLNIQIYSQHTETCTGDELFVLIISSFRLG